MLLLGEFICLFTALLWAWSVSLFRPAIELHGARTINMAKCTLAAALQGLTVLIVGEGRVLTEVSPGNLWLLAASGVIGLALGDTALFAAVARIGVHRTLLLQTLAPVFAAVLAAAWQLEVPTGRQALGAAIILVGIALVVAPERGRADVAGGWAAAGVAAGILAAAGQGFGLVLAKAALDEVPVVTASFVRLSTAAAALLLIGVGTGRISRLLGLARNAASLRRFVPATFLGSYLALFLMIAGVALAPAAIAAVLLASSPVFSLVIESVLDGRLPSSRSLGGTLLAIVGVGLLVTS